ncbi:uncharacterized protein BDV14DRAFT_176141 [Aspergillus stella-maris]|uniref:uncharacterized protein n=1 Tax=Aspergillus stella-maris TaxID=1810926 RepID=UPI003CCD62E6
MSPGGTGTGSDRVNDNVDGSIRCLMCSSSGSVMVFTVFSLDILSSALLGRLLSVDCVNVRADLCRLKFLT